MKTLRARLALWYAATALGLLAALGLSAYGLVRYQLLRHHDRDLAATAEDAKGVLARTADCRSLTADQRTDLDALQEVVLIHAVEGGGEVFYRSPGLESERVVAELGSPHGQALPAFATEGRAGVPVRVYTLPYRSEAGRRGLIRVAERLGDIAEPLASLRLALLLLAPVLGAASAGIAYWLAGRALAPVDAIVSAAREIEATSLGRRLPAHPVSDEVGRLVGTFNQMIARLERSFETMKRFTSDASHELRGPLATIRGTVDVTLSQRRSPEEYEGALASIGEVVDRLRRIAEDLLLLARADAGRFVLERVAVRLDVVASEVAETFRESASADGLRIEVDAPIPVTVTGDERWLRQVMTNLADNAVKFAGGPDGNRRVAIRVGRDAQGDATLDVEDDGSGIAAEHLPRVFDRFFRADEARAKGTPGGSGLGLSIAAWVVEAHGGNIHAESSPGIGTTIRVVLPG